MGVVYKARQISLGRTVALKVMRKGTEANSSDLARFQSETMAIAKLSHPNLVPLFEAGEQDGQPFLCMPIIEGETLAQRLTRGPLKPREAAKILLDVASAIHHAHQTGVVHRDLKPSNILLDRSGKPLVTDFGLAKSHHNGNDSSSSGFGHENSITNTGAILGTPAYMAPEQAFRFFGDVGPHSDIYSLGVILYEMLTGRPPFRAATPLGTLLLILDQEPVAPRMLNRQVDPDLEMVCLKALQKEPELRYKTMDCLVSDLEAWLSGNPVSLRRTGLGGIMELAGRLFRETHHAGVLENWGKLWMVHSGMVLVICIFTWGIRMYGITNPVIYLVLWTVGWILWGAILWRLRTRGGPILFIERQVAHVWAAAVFGAFGIFAVEVLLQLPVLSLSPLLAVVACMVFVVKAGMLSGEFYIYAFLLFASVIPMALFPAYNQLIFGAVAAFCFFLPGYKYHKQALATKEYPKSGKRHQGRIPAGQKTTVS
jgi:serine/threonine-protein kinase